MSFRSRSVTQILPEHAGSLSETVGANQPKMPHGTCTQKAQLSLLTVRNIYTLGDYNYQGLHIMS